MRSWAGDGDRPSLAGALADRLRTVAPPAIALFEEPRGWLTAQVDAERWVSVPVDEPDERGLDADVEYDPPYPAFGALAALDAVQELANDELAIEWPPGLPEAHASFDGDLVRLWFGEEDRPTLELEPIPLA